MSFLKYLTLINKFQLHTYPLFLETNDAGETEQGRTRNGKATCYCGIMWTCC